MSLKKWWRAKRPLVLSRIAYGIVRLIGRTIRIKAVGLEKLQDIPGGKVLCGWHGRSVVASIKFRNLGHWVIISKSKDGDIQTHIFENLGFKIIRGSTGRGGERALIESIRVLRKGETMDITPDGPRGPSRIVQGGVMLMAKKAGAALIPVGISARPRFIAKSWDQYMVPLPFARAILLIGEPFYVPEDASDEQIEEIRLRFQDALNDIEAEAEAAMGYA